MFTLKCHVPFPKFSPSYTPFVLHGFCKSSCPSASVHVGNSTLLTPDCVSVTPYAYTSYPDDDTFVTSTDVTVGAVVSILFIVVLAVAP